MNLLYYTGNSLLANAYDNATNASYGNLPFGSGDYNFFDQLAAFVRNRRRAAAISRVDISQNGNVDIVDVQIVANVMAGTDTNPDHISRADVNRDGVVDIVDYNTVLNVMLNGTDLFD